MLTAILISLAVVFVAELGDKSQLMTMTYALRHRWWVVLSGVAIAADPGARTVRRHRPFPRPDAARAPDRVRGRHRVPVVRGLDLAGGPRRRRRRRPGRRAAVRASSRSCRPSCSPNSATRRCSPPSHWPVTTTGRASGSAPPWAWCWPTAWPSPRARCCTSDCPSSSCTAWPACCSCCSACGCSSTAPSGCGGSPWRHRIGVVVAVGTVALVRFVRGRNAAPTTPASLEFRRSALPQSVGWLLTSATSRYREAVPLTRCHVAVCSVTDVGARLILRSQTANASIRPWKVVMDVASGENRDYCDSRWPDPAAKHIRRNRYYLPDRTIRLRSQCVL